MEQVGIEYRIAGARVIEFWAKDEPVLAPAGTLPLFTISVEYGTDEGLRFILVRPVIEAAIKGEESTNLFRLASEVAFEFKEGLRAFVFDNKLRLPDIVWPNLINIAIGMARGIVFLETSEFSFGPSLIPILDLTEFLPIPAIELNEAAKRKDYVKLIGLDRSSGLQESP